MPKAFTASTFSFARSLLKITPALSRSDTAILQLGQVAVVKRYVPSASTASFLSSHAQASSFTPSWVSLEFSIS